MFHHWNLRMQTDFEYIRCGYIYKWLAHPPWRSVRRQDCILRCLLYESCKSNAIIVTYALTYLLIIYVYWRLQIYYCKQFSGCSVTFELYCLPICYLPYKCFRNTCFSKYTMEVLVQRYQTAYAFLNDILLTTRTYLNSTFKYEWHYLSITRFKIPLDGR